MESKENALIRLRIDPDFKEEVEALAKAKQISVSALTRQLLAEEVEAHKSRKAAASDGKEAA